MRQIRTTVRKWELCWTNQLTRIQLFVKNRIVYQTGGAWDESDFRLSENEVSYCISYHAFVKNVVILV